MEIMSHILRQKYIIIVANAKKIGRFYKKMIKLIKRFNSA